MTQDADDNDKEHEASPHKLTEARKQGDAPRAPDLLMAAGIGGFLLALIALGNWVLQRAGSAGVALLDRSADLGRMLGSGSETPMSGVLLAMAAPILFLLLLPPILVLAVALVTGTLVFAPTRLAPKLSRISPFAMARQKFGREGLVEFGKSAFKLGIVAVILYLFLASRIEGILETSMMAPHLAMAFMLGLTREFLFVLVLLALCIGGADYLWQRYLFLQRNRMSRKEVSDEHKENEGDPHLKAARRQRAQEVATSRMLADVATADVVVVNPTHFAVALRWERTKGRAPVCVAKGMDEIALRIRERATEHKVPIHSDPPTARAIHATVEIGQEIRGEHYRAIAAAIRFADTTRKRAQTP